MNFILTLFSKKIPEEYNFLFYIIGALLLCYIAYRLISNTLLTSKFDLLFFNKSQLLTHTISKSIISIGAYQIFAIMYASILTTAHINHVDLAFWALLLFSITGIIMYLVVLFGYYKSRSFKKSRLNLNQIPRKDLTNKQRKVIYSLILSNVISGLAFYVLFISFLISTNAFTPENFKTPFDYFLIIIFFLLCPYLVVFLYNIFIKRTFKKNTSEKKQYKIKSFDINYLNNNNLITYYPLEKEKFILVTPENNHANEELVTNFFLYDLPNGTLHEFTNF